MNPIFFLRETGETTLHFRSLQARETSSRQRVVTVLDTFYGSFEKKGEWLCWDGHEIWYWGQLGLLLRAPQKVKPSLSNSIQDPHLQRLLKPVMGIRCLLPVEEIGFCDSCWNLRNPLGKIVLRLKSWRWESTSGALSILNLTPLKGYFSEAKGVEEELKTWEKTNVLPWDSIRRILGLPSMLEHRQKTPVLDAKDPASRIIPLLCRHYLDQIRINCVGTIEDLDTEFLHDLRVYSRKSRSILKLLRPTYPQELLELGDPFLVSLGKKTNQLRDLDVYLLNRDRYLRMLPDHERIFLVPFFEQLVRTRHTLHEEVSDFLGSDSFAQSQATWSAALESVDYSSPSIEYEGSVLNAAQWFIQRRFRKILQKGHALSLDSEDEAFHRLRIQCKKLRYLLDTFSSIFSKPMKESIKNLKQLQDILGDFNDLSVQEVYFKTYCMALPRETPDRDQILLAIGQLLSQFHQVKRELRARFFVEFRHFEVEGQRLITYLDGMGA